MNMKAGKQYVWDYERPYQPNYDNLYTCEYVSKLGNFAILKYTDKFGERGEVEVAISKDRWLNYREYVPPLSGQFHIVIFLNPFGEPVLSSFEDVTAFNMAVENIKRSTDKKFVTSQVIDWVEPRK